MVPKLGKPLVTPSFYNPVSLLPVLLKTFEKIFLKRFQCVITSVNIVPDNILVLDNVIQLLNKHIDIQVLTDCLEKQ